MSTTDTTATTASSSSTAANVEGGDQVEERRLHLRHHIDSGGVAERNHKEGDNVQLGAGEHATQTAQRTAAIVGWSHGDFRIHVGLDDAEDVGEEVGANGQWVPVDIDEHVQIQHLLRN